MGAYISQSTKKSLDWITLMVYLCLVIIGLMMVYAALYDETQPFALFDPTTEIGKQTLWVAISLIGFVLAFTLESKVWDTLSFPLYVLSILLLIGVLFLGIEIKGAQSWYRVGFFSFQPAELAKLSTALFISSFFSSYKRKITEAPDLFLGIGIVLLPILLILLQPDAGSALIFLSFFILFFRLGLNPMYYILAAIFTTVLILSIKYNPSITLLVLLIGLLVFMAIYLDHKMRNAIIVGLSILGSIVLFSNDQGVYALALLGGVLLYHIVLLIKNNDLRLVLYIVPILLSLSAISFGTNYAFEKVLRAHQQDRINVWLNPEKCDPHGSLYNIIQSKLAIGSGGFKGKGYLEGDMTKLNYVPEQSTDFIFSIIGEEQGFIGAVGVIMLFMILLIRIVIIGERAKSKFVRNYAYCISGIIFVHFFINISMTMGLMPVIGIPLPFISKGGSSLLFFSLMIAILLKLDLTRKHNRI